MKKIALEEAFISPYYFEYCEMDGLLEYNMLTGANKDNYNYLLDPSNLRFHQADNNNVTLVISATVPGSQHLKNTDKAPEFCRLTNDYFEDKVNSYNNIHKTHHSFFAVLPFNNPRDCLAELKRVNNFNPPINRVLFNGPTKNENTYEWLEDDEWNVVWEYANKHKTVFYCHPFIAKTFNNTLPDGNMDKFNKHYPQIIGSQFGFHVNCAIFYLKLYLNDIFEKYPDIQWVAGHMGESLLWYLWRFDHRTQIYRNEVQNLEDIERENKELHLMKFPKKSLTEIFRTSKGKKHAQVVCTTSGWFNTSALNFAIETVGIENILFSIDTPYEDFNLGLEWFEGLKLTSSYHNKLGWENANEILSIFPTKK